MTLRTDITDELQTDHPAQHNEVNAAVLALQNGTSVPIPANDTGMTTEVVTPDPATGSDSMTVIVLPADATFIAVKLEGDDWPRWFMTADATDGIYLGDGTFDPYGGGANISYVNGLQVGAGSGDLSLSGGTISASTDLGFLPNLGPIVYTPDGEHTYRLGVDNEGVVTATMIA